MKRWKMPLTLTFLMMLAGPGNARDLYRIAVLDLQPQEVDRITAAAVSEMLRSEMIKTGRYVIIERNEMDKILKEQSLALTGCTDQACAVRVGRLLSANKILIGTLARVSGEMIINIRVVDIERGTAEFAEDGIAGSPDLKDLRSAVAELTARLTSRIVTVTSDGAGVKKQGAQEERPDPVIQPGKPRTIGGMEFLFIPGGEFMMGSDEGEDDQKPVHRVKITGFWMGKFEVTQKEYEAVMGSNPSGFRGLFSGNRPVESVTWDDAAEFCRKFGEKHGVRARLPREAEWEYAARAGSRSEFFWGSSADEKYLWYHQNSGNTTRPVGGRLPNRFGLFDMSGNVWEWCLDRYDKGFYSRSAENDPQCISGSGRVVRGCGWIDVSSFCGTAYRVKRAPDNVSNAIGFRIVVTD